MPIRKFRTIEDMDGARRELWCDKPGAAYFKRVGEFWGMSSVVNPRKFPRGIFKFRTLEETQAHRDKLLAEHVQRLWQGRVTSGKAKIVQKGRKKRTEIRQQSLQP